MNGERILNHYNVDFGHNVHNAVYRMINHIAAVRSNLMVKFDKWSAQRTTRKELLSLSDAQLNDIGLSRYDIERMLKNSK
ncbi:MAG: DUF1127 domain-containing protein [Alphaproteobacteria bacterium]